MPRADRTFKAADILRIYCRHLDPAERAVVETVGLVCEDVDLNDKDLIVLLLELLLEPPLSSVVALAPASDYIEGAIRLAILLLKADAEIGDINPDLLLGNPVLFLDLDQRLPET